ncbi:MAG TPA: DUF1385 domain-containing protein, partial [Abditibacterium sp.]
MDKPKPQFQLGGQALIEGVMMRGPRFVGAAVRRADGSIQTRVEEFTSILKKRPYLNVTFVRGIFALVEMMRLGTGYLNWSSNLALEDEAAKNGASQKSVTTLEEPLSGTPILSETVSATQTEVKAETEAPLKQALPIWLFLLTIAGSLGLGALLFVATPNLLTHYLFKPLIGSQTRPSIMALTFIEGAIKLSIFIAYVFIIGRRKQIKRVFEYHGAEHKVVYAVEKGCPLSPDGARPFDTPHPRCGTGFALLTVVVSIFCYSLFPWPDNHFVRIGMRLALLPLVA